MMSDDHDHDRQDDGDTDDGQAEVITIDTPVGTPAAPRIAPHVPFR